MVFFFSLRLNRRGLFRVAIMLGSLSLNVSILPQSFATGVLDLLCSDESGSRELSLSVREGIFGLCLDRLGDPVNARLDRERLRVSLVAADR